MSILNLLLEGRNAGNPAVVAAIADEVESAAQAIAAAQALGFTVGAKVTLRPGSFRDNEVGEVVGYNDYDSLFYPGSRYPLRVKFAQGTFEYALTEVLLV